MATDGNASKLARITNAVPANRGIDALPCRRWLVDDSPALPGQRGPDSSWSFRVARSRQPGSVDRVLHRVVQLRVHPGAEVAEDREERPEAVGEGVVDLAANQVFHVVGGLGDDR